MNISELGAVGELLGSIAIIVTLIFLAAQVRSAKRALRAQLIQGRINQSVEASQLFYNSPYLPEIIDKAFTRQEVLGAVDALRLRQYVDMRLRVIEGCFLHFQLGLIDEETWRGHLYQLSKGYLFDNSLTRNWWESSSTLYDPGFSKLVDRVFVEEPALNVDVQGEELVQFHAAADGAVFRPAT